ncbi:hypothetical protein jhhlp_001181 [Lomentospora prolificans]|uniref:Trafficking protein particle complex subunit 6B n=1 Tax=Lomentospora prolificans TaxID=41688 RepID=A0A2N3NHJ7_9PEZI|nr:hypothetical protein jhhlp_001181 [Lomentospora prolificans]
MSFGTTVMPPYNSTDPNASFLNVSCLDFLLIELVPLAYRVTNELEPPSEPSPGGDSTSNPPGSRRLDEEEEREAASYRLETLGYRVGLESALFRLFCAGSHILANTGLLVVGVQEPKLYWGEARAAVRALNVLTTSSSRFSRERPRFNDTLDVIKFICKDLWSLVFRKQIDNLKTNHRGTYVLTDSSFRPLSRMSTEAGGQAVVKAAPFLLVPCGIIRGALAAMGVNATVQADASELPTAVFQIKTVIQKS